MKLSLLLALPLVFAIPSAAQSGTMQHGKDSGPAMEHAHKKMGPPSTSLTLTVGSGAPVTLHLDDLKAMPQVSVTARNGHSGKDETYAGPTLADVLAKAGLVLTEKTEHDILHMVLIAKGTDNYWVAYSGAEVQPGFNASKVIVGITREGQPLTTSGQFELVNSADKKPARWLHNLTSITVKSAE